nr:zinc finger protein ZAT1-like [Ipomoea batatas]
MQEPERMAAENNGNNLYTPALRKTRESKPLVGEEKYGTWMIVKRKPRRPPRNPEVRSEQRPHSANMKPSGTTKTKVYNNQLFNSRYGPLDDLETEEPESPLAQTPKDPAHTFNAPRQPEPNYNQPVIQYQRKAQPKVISEGGGGRTNAPRRAAAEEEHTVVRGSLKGKTITREVIHHQLRPPDLTSPHVRQPPKPNGPTEEGADFFDCFSPRDAMEEDGGVFLHWLMLRMIIMAMKMQKCKLCWKEFANGKALGGHLRSHLAPLPPPKTPPENQDPGGVDPTRKPTQGRSKRARRLFVSEENKESADTEENIAMCLLMLSDDVRGDSGTIMKRRKTSKDKENFRCEICNGVFKCSQALGSHRTAHRNKMMNAGAGGFDREKLRNLGVKVEGKRLHECPFCGKIFGSGQALGGDKRSHSSSGSSKLDESLMVDSNPDDNDVLNTMIDLNFPAQVEDDNRDLSQPQFSVDSELNSNPKSLITTSF